MSDEKLRELERRWRESGTVEDEAAWLRERVRVGDLSQERLELAAYCGHAAAIECSLGKADLEAVVASLPTAAVRLAIAAYPSFFRLLDRFEGHGLYLARSLEAAEHWALCPCDDHAQEVLNVPETGLGPHPVSVHWVEWMQSLDRSPGGLARRVEELREEEVGVDQMIAMELVPWALGYGDPVRDRVEARRAAGGDEDEPSQ